MLPPLFGVSWGMYPVIAAIVLLVILLLVSVSQRRKKAALSAHLGAAPVAKGKSGKHAAKADKSPKHQTKAEKAAMYAELRRQAAAAEAAQAGLETVPAQGYNYATGAAAPAGLPQTPLPPVGYVPPSPPGGIKTAPAPSAYAIPIEDILPGADPLQAIIVDLLSGWGDLTQEDTNRLSVFRPDRVLAAVGSADIPRELKSNEYARARLAQLRRWASGLEQAARKPAAAPVAQPEYAVIGAIPAIPSQPMVPPAQMAPAQPPTAPRAHPCARTHRAAAREPLPAETRD